MKHIVNKETGKFQCFLMTEEEYRDYTDNYIGLCISCGAERECCEPDAEKYKCEECGKTNVYGVEQLMLLCRIGLSDHVIS